MSVALGSNPMRTHAAALATLLLLIPAGCTLPGRPTATQTPPRPDQITDFHALYAKNCAACHGVDGKQGNAISMANPVYIAYAGEANIAKVTGAGIPGSLMPPFSKSRGGLLTDQQVNLLAHGIVTSWANPAALNGATPPPYESAAIGDATRGEAVYRADCLRCHAPGKGSILDPAYLALISDGGLRTLMVSGVPATQSGAQATQSGDQAMPDWRGYTPALTDATLADLVTFLTSHRTPHPGQPYHNAQGAAPATTPHEASHHE